MLDVAGRVSLIVWRDPDTDEERLLAAEPMVLAQHVDETYPSVIYASDVMRNPDDYEAWAELPTPSEAT